MNKPIDEVYFIWLCGQVGAVDEDEYDPSRTHDRILKHLFDKEFIWIVDNDDNRAEDGLDLRAEFCRRYSNIAFDVDPEWFELGCSMLEMMIGLSRRLSFLDEGEPRDWFWLLMRNLGIAKYNDATPIPAIRVNRILDGVIWRTYESNGKGGLFPLKEAAEDQRDVELWYQLQRFLLDAA